jgi:hypothetical protein
MLISFVVAVFSVVFLGMLADPGEQVGGFQCHD